MLNLIAREHERPHLVEGEEDIHSDEPLVIVTENILIEANLRRGVLRPKRLRLFGFGAEVFCPGLELLKQTLRFLDLGTVGLSEERRVLLRNLPSHHHSHGLLSLALMRILGPDFGY